MQLKHGWRLGAVVLVAGIIGAGGYRAIGQQGSAEANAPYMNPTLPMEQRVDDLISRMTVEEKASQLVNQARAIPRLNVPAYDWWSEALHGVANSGFATVFPQAIAMGATWDTPLLHEVAIVISTEGRAKHHEAVRQGRRDIFEGLTFWSPNINIFRDPRWGRGQETYGEDPFLTGRMGIAFVTGMQGDDPKYYRVIATPKHFAVHSGPEPMRHFFDVDVSKHDMEDTYLPAFRAAVTEGKAGSVMCVYNSVKGQPGCANTFLLQDQLRGKWGFQGYVVSDCDAVADIERGHHYTNTQAEAAAVSLKAGTDNECADFTAKAKDNSDYVKYVDAVKQGLLTSGDLDVSLRRLFMARFKLGQFDPPEMVKYAQIPLSENDTEASRQLALKAARKTMVLLKNDGVLPLASTTKRIAVVGPLADQIYVLEGNYNGTPSRATSALDGIKKQFPGGKVTFEPGTDFLRPPTVVEASLLSTPDGKPGLKAEYFAGKEFQGQPILTRMDPTVDFGWESRPSAPEGAKEYSVRWTGFITPTQSGKYTIGLDGLADRLYLDGKLVVDDSTMHAPQPKTAELQLEKGHKYAIKIEQNLGLGVMTKLVWAPLLADPKGRAVEAAKQADVVIAVVGITSRLEGEEMDVTVPGFKGGDRTSIDLPKDEEDLLKAVKATGKPLVVVLMSGSALSVNWANENANAILEAWYAGEEGGAAIAETIAGVNNPAGRLPVTFYKGVDQLPIFEDYSMSNRTYRYFAGKPLYPFGYGLSYSKFAYDNAKLSAESIKAGDSLAVDVDVHNTSQRDGDEVAQVYLNFPKAPGAPIRALRGFTRVSIPAGQTQHVHFDLSPRDLSLVNNDGDRMVAAGKYTISIGGGQPGTGAPSLDVPLTIEQELRLTE
jgi:beta-glucosidase